MKKKKTFILTIIGLFIFLFGVIGITYAYWQLTLTQSDENLVYTDCLKLTVDWGEKGFTLENAYPMTNEELVSDFFPSQAPYHFTIENQCNNEVPISINMESITTTDPQLKDDYVDVILWESETTEKFNPETNIVLSHKGSGVESKYRLIDNAKNESMIADNAKAAYQLYKFKLEGGAAKQFNLLLFMDYATPVDGTMVGEEIVHTNNANWAGKITLNNYEIPKVKIGGIEVELAESGDGLYEVDHKNDGDGLGTEWKVNPEYRYAGVNPNNYVWFNCAAGTNSGDNCEKWRIIGLVNVQTSDRNVEQRIKIIRDDVNNTPFGNYSWDDKTSGVGSSDSDYGSNDWTDSQLMEKLNGEYYEGEVTDSGAKGLSEIARDMIDKDIIWNIGGWSTGSVKTADMYKYERGENVYGERPTTWSSSNTKRPATEAGESTPESGLFHSVGLMYPSDYGYAVGGTSRDTCLTNTTLLYYDNAGCHDKDWLALGSDEWLLSPFSSASYIAFYVGSGGYVGNFVYVYGSGAVRPVVYLTSKVKISGGTGDSESPIGSEENPFILTME